jgi:capsular polysaccharide biosynthesis protein
MNNETTMNVHELLKSILRWSWLVVIALVVGFFVGNSYVKKQPVHYTASVSILSQSKEILHGDVATYINLSEQIATVQDYVASKQFKSDVEKELLEKKNISIDGESYSLKHTSGSSIVTLSVSSKNKGAVATIDNIAAQVLINKLKIIFNLGGGTVITPASTPSNPVDNGTKQSRNVIMLAFGGVSVLVAVVLEYLRRERVQAKQAVAIKEETAEK